MLLNRKGFVKIAVEQGLDGGIIPVYHYGNTQVGRSTAQGCVCCVRLRAPFHDRMRGYHK